jgi:hypothetical protein
MYKGENLMKNFLSEKVIFALTLLATLFAMSPIISEYGDLSYEIMNINISISLCYYTTLGVLGLSVYLYSFNMISETRRLPILKIADMIYTAALFIPVVFGLWWLISIFIKLNIFQSDISKNIFTTLSTFIVASIVQVYMRKIIKELGNRDKKRYSEQLSDNEIKSFDKATRLLGLNLYSASIIEAFSGLEFSVKKIMNNKNVIYDKKDIKLFDLAISKKFIPEEYKIDIETIRILRNKAAHPTEIDVITKQDAEDVLNKVKAIFTELNNVTV